MSIYTNPRYGYFYAIADVVHDRVVWKYGGETAHFAVIAAEWEEATGDLATGDICAVRYLVLPGWRSVPQIVLRP